MGGANARSVLHGDKVRRLVGRVLVGQGEGYGLADLAGNELEDGRGDVSVGGGGGRAAAAAAESPLLATPLILPLGVVGGTASSSSAAALLLLLRRSRCYQ